MSKNMESKPATPSVIARLMGLDELQSQQPVDKQKKQQRVLSENYLHKVASIGAWKKRSFDECHSFQFSIEEQKEFKDALEVIESLERDKGSESFAVKGRVDLRSSRERITSLSGSFSDAKYVPERIKRPKFVDSIKGGFENRLEKPGYTITKHFYDQEGVPSHMQSGNVRFLESLYDFQCEKIDLCKKVGSITNQENPKLLQKLDNGFVKDSQRKYGHDSTSMIPRFHLESNNERCSSSRKIVILKLKPGEVKTDKKAKGFLSHRKGNSHAQVKEGKNFPNGVKSTMHRSVRFSETEKEITRKTRDNISDSSLEPPRLGFSGAYGLTKEPDFMMVSSHNNSNVNNWYKPSCYYLDGSYVAQEAKQQISEKWRKTKKFRENRLTIGGRGRSRTLGEMLELSDRAKRASFCGPFGISSRDGWKNGGVGDLIRSRSHAYSTSVGSPITRTTHKAFRFASYLTMRPMFQWIRRKSIKQGSSGKDCPKQSPDLESEKNHLIEDKYVIHNILKNNLEKQDPSEENYLVSKSIKHNVAHSNSENEITPIDRWNDIKDVEMSAEDCVVPESSMYSTASPSFVTDVVVAVETAGFCKSTGNHNQQQFESTDCTMSKKDHDSSFCIPDAWSQQEDISTKISKECATDPDFLVNLETANQPSPVSVLEAPFMEGNLLSSKCFLSVTASLNDVKRQLEFLKSESIEEYSEGSGMVVSSDDKNDAREESKKDSEVNEYSTKLFGVAESRDFSYLVDVLTEAGFHSRSRDILFNRWHSPETPISPSVFETLEKKYGEQVSCRRSARRLLFDRINSGLMEILRPCLGDPMWVKPVARRLSYLQNSKEILEELYIWLVSQENEVKKNSSEKVFGKDDGWISLGYDIEAIGREIEYSLIDELAAEAVSL